MSLSNPTSLAAAVTSTGPAVTSAAFTPVANELIVVVATYGSAGAAAAVTLAISDTLGGLAWTQYTHNALSGANGTTTSIFAAVAPASPIAGTVTVTPSNTTNANTGVWMQPFGVTGAPTSSPIGATLSVGSNTGALSAAPAASSLVISLINDLNGSNPANTAPTGYTAVVTDNQSGAFNWSSLAYQNGSASQTVTWGGGVNNLVAIEILAPTTTVPGAPTGAAAVAGAAAATVTFTAPASNGGSPITGYTATSTPGGLTGSVTGAAAAPITVAGLTVGVSYTFTVHATNAIGNSAESAASNAVIPTASTAGPPAFTVLADLSGTAFGAAPSWTDITNWVLTAGSDPPINITWGKGDEVADPQPRTCTFRLDNSDGRFSPGRAASPYYPHIDLGIRVRVTIREFADYARFDGYVNDWAASWDGGGPMAIVDVSCSDIVARLGEDVPLYSILTETILKDSPAIYLPLTDGQDATAPSVLALPAGGAVTMKNSKYGAGTAAFGVGLTPTAEGSAGLRLTQPSATAGTVVDVSNVALVAPWSNRHLIRLSWAGTSIGDLVMLRTAAGVKFGLSVNAARLLVGTYNGQTFTTSGVPGGWINDGQVHDIAIEIDTSALEMWLWVDGSPSPSGALTAAPTLTFTQMQIGGQADARGVANMASGDYGHVAVFLSAPTGSGVGDPFNQFVAGATGFAGERIDQRIARLLTFRPNTGSTLDTARSVTGNDDLRGSTLTDALLQLARAEGGLVFVDGLGSINFYKRSRLYNPAVGLTLDATLDQVASDLVFRLDPQLVSNDITYTRSVGGSAQRLYDTASRAKYGYRATSDSRPYATDRDALDAAGFDLASRKTAKSRSPQTTVDLMTEPSQTVRRAVLAAGPWTVLNVTGLPAIGPAVSVTEVIEGGSEQIGVDAWNVSFFTSPLPPGTLRADAAASANTKLDAGLVIPR